MVHRREINGDEIVFGNQGALWGNAMTWWDHDTGSVWSQPLGEAILGEREGSTVEMLPSTLTTWESWLAAHPETLAIDAFGFPMVVGLEQLAIVVDLGFEAVAYEYPILLEHGVVNDVVAGIAVAVVIDPTDKERWAVFSRRLDDRIVDLVIAGGELRDSATGTRFDPFRGFAIDGPLQGKTLDRLAALTVFPKDFETFWPQGRFWAPPS
jgi:hypothetical protein